MRDRASQIALIASILCLSWLGMQVVHEAGHVLVARVCGETVSRVVLHPLAISRTDVTHDRHPMLVVLGGPILGSLIPLAALGMARLGGSRYSYLLQFFAGFCLLANGLYLGVGSLWGVGDAGDLIRDGGPRWVPVLLGFLAAPLGLFLWHGLGSHFGLGTAQGEVDRRATVGTIVLLLALVAVEVLARFRGAIAP